MCNGLQKKVATTYIRRKILRGTQKSHLECSKLKSSRLKTHFTLIFHQLFEQKTTVYTTVSAAQNSMFLHKIVFFARNTSILEVLSVIFEQPANFYLGYRLCELFSEVVYRSENKFHFQRRG